MQTIGYGSWVYEFRLTRANQHLSLHGNGDLCLSGPWLPVRTNKPYQNLEDAAEALFGYWFATNGGQDSMDSLRLLLTPEELSQGGHLIALSHGDRVKVECRCDHLNDFYEGTFKVGLRPYMLEDDDA